MNSYKMQPTESKLQINAIRVVLYDGNAEWEES